jgi:tetratricopeptide (TPR) repeat protein
MRPRARSNLSKVAFWVFLPSYAIAQNSSLQERIAEGMHLEARGDFIQARRILRDAARDAERGGASVILLAAALDGLANVDRDEGRYLDAETDLTRALSITERVTGPQSPSTGLILWHLIGVYAESGRLSAAGPVLRRYESIIVLHAHANTVSGADDLGNLGRIYMQRNETGKALPLFERAIEIIEKQSKGNEIAIARALLDRGSALAVLGRLDEAVADVERARSVVTSLNESFPVLRIQLNATAGMVYARARRADDSETAFEEGIRIAESSYGHDHPIVAIVMRDNAQGLRLLGRKKEASDLEKQAGRILSANHASNPLGQTIDIQTLRPR